MTSNNYKVSATIGAQHVTLDMVGNVALELGMLLDDNHDFHFPYYYWSVVNSSSDKSS